MESLIAHFLKDKVIFLSRTLGCQRNRLQSPKAFGSGLLCRQQGPLIWSRMQNSLLVVLALTS